jgi:hypothetical protein
MLGLSRRTTILASGVAILLVAAGVFALTASGEPEPLTAAAGPDQTVECASPQGATATLDATASHPATNGTVTSYDWYENYNTSAQSHIASGAKVAALLPLGEHRITLVVAGVRPNETANATENATENETTNETANESVGDNATANSTISETAIDEVVVRIVDTTAPTITAAPSTGSLWPPNHKLRSIGVDVRVSDACSSPTWVLSSAASDEADDGKGDGHTVGDLQGVDVGSPDTSFDLRAERAGPGDGREYRFVYTATDGSGNVATATALVLVPHGA